MINIFKTEQSVIRTIDAFEDGAWVQMVDPSVQELNKFRKHMILKSVTLRLHWMRKKFTYQSGRWLYLDFSGYSVPGSPP